MREHIFSRHPLLIPFFGSLSGILLDSSVLILFFLLLYTILKIGNLPYSKFLIIFVCFSLVSSFVISSETVSFKERIYKIQNGKEVIFQVKQIQESSSGNYLLINVAIKGIDKFLSEGQVKVIIKKDAPILVGGVYCAKYTLLEDNAANYKFAKFNFSRDLLGVLMIKPNDLYFLEGYNLNTYASSDKVRKQLIDVCGVYLSEISNNLYQRTFLGIKSKFSKKQLQGFKMAGVMHALTISGMHLAIIFGALVFPVNILMRKWHFARWFKIFSIPVLWFYSEITGSAPPVERAFVFIAISVLSSLILDRKIRIKDLIFTVGTLYLVFQPKSIFDISVQLSFAAVFGIAWIVPLLKMVWIPKNVIVDFLWSSICMSLGCTISTLPFILYYFGEISSGFIIGNLILGPLFTVWVVLSLVVSLLILLNVNFVYNFGFEFMNLLSALIEYISVKFYLFEIPILKVSRFTQFHLGLSYLVIIGMLVFCINWQESKTDKIL